MRLANERFAVPEMLFHPADIGIQEMGIPEAIVDSIQSLPEGQTTSWRWRQRGSLAQFRSDQTSKVMLSCSQGGCVVDNSMCIKTKGRSNMNGRI